MKKLVFFTGGLKFGGMERVIFIATELLKDDYDITIATLYKTDADYNPEYDLYNIDVPPESGKLKKIKVAIKRLIGTRRMKRELKPDIVFSFGMYLNYLNVFSKINERIIMGIRSYDWLTKPFVSKRIDRFVVNKFDSVNAVSKKIANDTNMYWGMDSSKIRVIYNPYDINLIQKLSEEVVDDYTFNRKERYIITMGRLADQKGYNHLIRVFHKVHQTINNLHLIIMGNGDKEYELRKMIRDYKIEDSVDMIGGKSNPYKYIKNAELYVLSSHSEGFPNALVEAMCVGTPIVTVNCPSGPAEILLDKADACINDDFLVTDYGILSRELNWDNKYCAKELDSNENSLYEAIMFALSNRETVTECSRKAKQRVMDFSYNRFREKLKCEIENIQ